MAHLIISFFTNKKSALFALVCFLAVQSTLAQGVYQAKDGLAEFKSEVPLHSFTGTSNHLVGKISLADSTVDFYLDLATLDTGNNKRDKDMRETLEVEKYPFAEFFGKLVSDFNPQVEEPQPVTVSGEFTIHNVTQRVEIEGTLKNTSGGLSVDASWTLNMTDYDIRPPGILFYRVDEEIDVHIKATLKPITNETNASE